MTEAGLLVQRVVYAGLDALRTVVPLDLCACVHVAEGASPQLYLRAPQMAALDANDAFNLFGALRDLAEEGRPSTTRATVAGHAALANAAVGSASRSVWVVGRLGGALEAGEEKTAMVLLEAIATVVHALDEARSSETTRELIRVEVAPAGDGTSAEVWVPIAGVVRSARADGGSPVEAVAAATLAAADPSLKLVAAAEDEISDERAVLVLVRDDLGRVALGSSLCGAEPLHATAFATLQATRML